MWLLRLQRALAFNSTTKLNKLYYYKLLMFLKMTKSSNGTKIYCITSIQPSFSLSHFSVRHFHSASNLLFFSCAKMSPDSKAIILHCSPFHSQFNYHCVHAYTFSRSFKCKQCIRVYQFLCSHGKKRIILILLDSRYIKIDSLRRTHKSNMNIFYFTVALH